MNPVLSNISKTIITRPMSTMCISNDTLIVKSNTKNRINLHLNRPDKLNALTLDQVIDITSILKNNLESTILVTSEGNRAFCAGGDVMRILKEKDSGWNLSWFSNEYRMNSIINNRKPPFISLWAGYVMGGGVGLSIYGSHRIATETTKFAMPETGIGFIPDIGASWFLSRKFIGVGFFLGLSGHIINTRDLLNLEYATHYIKSSNIDKFNEMFENNIDIDEICQSLGEIQCEIEPSLSSDICQELETVFSQSNNILEYLNQFEKNDTLSSRFPNLRKSRCPISMSVWYEQFKLGIHAENLEECLKREYKIVTHFTHVDNLNFAEGIDFTLLRKGKGELPKYNPSTVENVCPDKIDEIINNYHIKDMSF